MLFKKENLPWNKGIGVILKKICQSCNKEFFWEARPSRVKMKWGKFCSRSCTAKFHYDANKFTMKGKKPWNYKQIEINCSNCDKKILISPSRVKIYTRHFCSRKCKYSKIYEWTNQEKNVNWKGGKWITSEGYVAISLGHNKRIAEHRFVMQKYLDRKLKPYEIIHHKNGDKTDNKIENLELLTRYKHIEIHRNKIKRITT